MDATVPIFDRAQATHQHVSMFVVSSTDSDSLTATAWCIAVVICLIYCGGGPW
jgi:hypothetical protein